MDERMNTLITHLKKHWSVWAAAAAFLTAVTYHVCMQFSFVSVMDPDGYLHFRMAEWIRDIGVKYHFKWAIYSTFFDQFSDKDFLFHVFEIPFTYIKDRFIGAKVFSCAGLAVFLGVFWYLLRKQKNDWAFAFLIFVVSSPIFIVETCRPRPFPYLFAVTLLLLYFFSERKHKAAGVTAFFYSLLHVTGPYAVLYALIAEVVRWLKERSWHPQNILWALGGVVFGYIVHPNFPNDITQFFLNSIMVPYYAAKGGILELGAEFFPIPSDNFFVYYPFMHMFTLGVLFLALVRKHTVLTTRAAIYFTVFAMFYVFSFKSQRYLTQAWPLALMFFSEFFVTNTFTIRKINLKPFMAIGLCLLSFVWMAKHQKDLKAVFALNDKMHHHYVKVAKALDDNSRDGTLVFHTNWSDSQYLIGMNPNNLYMVTLDPVYMYHKMPKEYQLYRAISHGKTKEPYALIREHFKAGIVYSSKQLFPAFASQVQADKRFRVVYEDDMGFIATLDTPAQVTAQSV
jgi:hypothetical protein